MNMQVVRAEGNDNLWRDFIDTNEQATFFHTLEWRDIIAEIYGFLPVYLIALDTDGEVSGIMPSFFTKSHFFGKKIVSTPFNFYNGPLFNDREAGKALIDNLTEIGKEKGARYIELKTLKPLDENLEAGLVKREHYYISGLKLEDDVETAYQKKHRKNMRTILKNAEKNGISVQDMRNVDDLKSFYDLMVKEYRDKHLMIPQPYSLFSLLISRLAPKGMAKLLVAKHEEKVIGGMFLLLYRDKAIYAWGTTDESFSRYSVSSLLVDYAIKDCQSKGFKSFDFGVTSPYQESLLFFKSRWGASHTRLSSYYKLINCKKAPEMDYYKSYLNLRRPFRYLPLWLIKAVSPIVTKQLS
jgi:lipid II:glycine glycyltransferase (peptidoglycan interpeptide bridge formation enzyme)